MKAWRLHEVFISASFWKGAHLILYKCSMLGFERDRLSMLGFDRVLQIALRLRGAIETCLTLHVKKIPRSVSAAYRYMLLL